MENLKLFGFAVGRRGLVGLFFMYNPAYGYWLDYWHTLITKDTSGFMSNTLLIRFSIMLSLYIFYML